MNDDSATTEPTREDQPELARRLDLLADTTTLDVDAAWDTIQARLATGGQDRVMSRRRALLAVAAALVVLLGATIILTRDDGGKVRTVDRTTTTDGTTTSTSRRSTTTATPPPPPDGAPSATGASGAPTDLGPGGERPGSPGGQDGPGQADHGGPTPPTSAPSTRLVPVATWASPYEVEIVFYAGHVFFRRVDGLGSKPGYPDGHGHYVGWIPPSLLGGAQCLATTGGAYELPDAPGQSWIWGLAGSNIASIAITMADQSIIYTGPAMRIHEDYNLRAWVISLPPGPIERIEGSDASANVVATITDPLYGYDGSSGC